MTLKERLAQINKIEKHFPVYTLKYRGLAIWPLLRLWIFTNTPHDTAKKTPKTVKKASAFMEIRFYLKLFLNTCWSIVKDFKHSNLKLRRADIIYVASVERRNERVHDRNFSKFADAMYSFLESDYRVQNLEFSVGTTIPTSKYFPAYNLNFRLYSALFLNKIKKQPITTIHNFDKFQTFLKENNLTTVFPLNAAQVRREADIVLSYKNVFFKVLEKINPKVAFHTCFYAKANMGLILAANELNIRTVEVQHGQQGDYHNMYTSWENIPAKGYDLLPTHFWMWGQRSADRIKRWAKQTIRHQVIVGGNPWLAFFVASNHEKITPKNNNQINILVSLQLPETLNTSFLAEAISQSPANYTWYIRLHPRYMHTMNDMKAHFEAKGCINVEFEQANSQRIYDLFGQMNFHITFWSTTAYEAIAFDIPTILIHPNGKDAMAKYIELGIFQYAANENQLLEIIEKNNFQPEIEKYIHANPVLIQKEVRSLLLGAGS